MTSHDENTYLLAGDIGGTKTSIALIDPARGPANPLVEETIQNDSVSSLDEIIASFLKNTGIQPQFGCFGVAGPVINNRVQLTNRNWFLDGNSLQQQFNLQSIYLINDLVATALGAVHLPDNALQILNNGQPDPQGAAAVIAPGTGLGEAFLIRAGNRLLPCPSEGGHSSFAPVNDRQTKLLNFMLQKEEYVSTEMVCSGLGIPNLYDFLKTEIDEPPELAARFSKESDPAKIISEAALDVLQKKMPGNDLALQTMQLFVDILASEAANLVLKVLATGGLYIGGGIPPRMLPLLKADNFMHSFCQGEYRDMLGRTPVHIILEPKTALIGAAAYCISMFNQPDENT